MTTELAPVEIKTNHLLAATDLAIERIEQGEAAVEDMRQSMAFMEQLSHAVKALRERHKAACINWIDKNGDLVDGEKRYYVGVEKATRCTDPLELLSRVLEMGVPADVLAKCLVSQPFKPATTKELIGLSSEGLFETITKPDLLTGKPQRKLLSTRDAMES